MRSVQSYMAAEARTTEDLLQRLGDVGGADAAAWFRRELLRAGGLSSAERGAPKRQPTLER